MWIFALIVTLSGLVSPPSDPAAWSYRAWNSAHGLGHETVLSVHRDQRGFLWAATLGGVYRFDGRVFSRVEGVGDSYIHGFLEDADGTLWIATRNGGLRKFDWRTDRFTAYLPGKNIHLLARDRDGRLWTSGLGDGLFRYDAVADTFRAVPLLVDGRTAGLSRGIVAWPGGPVVFNTDLGIVLVEDPDADRLAGTLLVPAGRYQDRSAELLLDADGRLVVLAETVAPIRLAPPVNRRPESAIVTASRAYLHGRDLLYGSPDGTLLRYRPDGRAETIPILETRGRFVNQFHRDREGHLWLSVWGSGVLQVIPEARFVPVRPPAGERFVLSFAPAGGGTVWVGTSAGVMAHTPRTGAWAPVRGGVVPYVMEPSARGILVGTQFHGLLHLGLDGRLLEAWNRVNGDPHIRAVRTDRQGRLWIGTENSGIVVRDPATGTATVLDTILPDQRIRYLLEGPDGDFFASTFRGGLLRITFPNRVKAYPLRFPHAGGLALQGDTLLWIPTYGGGLHALDLRTDALRHWSVEDGLPTDQLYGALVDAEGRVWVSTNNGLARYDPVSDRFTPFTASDGLQNNEFNTGAHLAHPDGHFWFGGIAGFNRFDPTAVRADPVPPPIHITGIELFDKPYLSERSVLATDTVRLQPGQRFIGFTWAAPDFRDPMRTRFRYRLVGVDPGWSEPGDRTYARYPALAPGTHVFEVTAANADGVWNPIPDRLVVILPPPFWQTWWFRSLIGLVLLLAFAAFIRHWATRQLKRRLEALEAERRLREERDRISRDLHDHVGAQLVTILSGVDLARRRPEAAEGILGSIRESAQHTLGQLRDTIWTLKTADPTPEAFVAYLEKHLAGIRSASGLEIVVESRLHDPRPLPPQVTLNGFRMVQEAVQNTLKHAGATRIDILVEADGRELKVEVRDDGTFRPPPPDHDGSGTDNMRRRASELGGRIEWRIGPGTTVRIQIPLP